MPATMRDFREGLPARPSDKRIDVDFGTQQCIAWTTVEHLPPAASSQTLDVRARLPVAFASRPRSSIMKLSCALTLVFAIGAASAAAQTFGGPFAPLPIPEGLAACAPGAPAAVTVMVPSGYGPAATLTVSIDIAHTWYGDVKLAITNPAGLTITALVPGCEGSLDDGSDLAGVYVLDDAGAMTLDAASAAAAAVIPPGTYAPDNALAGLLVCGSDASGAWTFTFDDHFNVDPGTLNALTMTLMPGPAAPAGPVYTLCQAGPGAPVYVTHAGGVPGATFINPVVVGAGATPNGWFFGLDIRYDDLILELSFAPGIFSGVLDPTGAFTSAPLPLPAGLVLGTVGVHFDPGTALPVFASEPFDFLVL
jgi:hypothetical protein